MEDGFNATLYQIHQGYRYFRGEELPGKLPFVTAANDLIRDFGRLRVKTVMAAIGDAKDDADAQAAAKAADPGETTP